MLRSAYWMSVHMGMPPQASYLRRLAYAHAHAGYLVPSTVVSMNDSAFEMAAAAIRFGVGVTREVGLDLADLGVRNVLVVTDPVMARLPPVRTVLESLETQGLRFVLY